MDRVVLRKLSLRSVMSFGKYEGYCVQQVLDSNPMYGRKYLIWCYYNLSNIGFITEVLNVLKIPENLLIEKPGKDPMIYAYNKFDIISNVEFDEKARKIYMGSIMRKRKQHLISIEKFERKCVNRNMLIQKNYGH